MPGLPQPVSLFGVGRPLEISTAEFSSDLRQTLSLFNSVGFSAMKFQKQSRCNFEISLGVIIDGFDLSFINKLDSGNRDTELYGCYYSIDCRFDIRESADSRCDRFRYAIQTKCDFGNYAESAFRTYKQSCQVVTRGRFPGTAGSLDDSSVCQYHSQREDVLPHSAITNRVGS